MSMISKKRLAELMEQSWEQGARQGIKLGRKLERMNSGEAGIVVNPCVQRQIEDILNSKGVK